VRSFELTGGVHAGGCAISPVPEDRHSELPHPEGALTWRFKTEWSGSGVCLGLDHSLKFVLTK
jgi:hypothetical protein